MPDKSTTKREIQCDLEHCRKRADIIENGRALCSAHYCQERMLQAAASYSIEGMR